MPDFKPRLRAIMRQRGIKKSELARMMDKAPSAVSNIFNGNGNPKMTTIAALASVLECSADELIGIGPKYSATAINADDAVAERVTDALNRTLLDAQHRVSDGTTQPSIEEVTDWWWAQSGILSDMTQLSEFLDIYHAPNADSSLIQSARMGSQSEAARTFQISHTAQLNNVLYNLNKPFAEALAQAQRLTIASNQPSLSMEEIVVPIGAETVSVAYRRLYLPVKDNADRPYIINLSERLTTSQPQAT